MTRPLVSLCMATYSRPDLFPETFDRLLKQTYDPLEIVILVDGGRAESVEVIRRANDPRVRSFTTPKPSGMVKAWNRVCRVSTGKYFLFCADDDILLDGAIDEQVELMELHPSVAFCHADFVYIDDDGREIGRWESHRGRFVDRGLTAWPDYLLGTRACMQTTVVRRSTWDQAGGWDEGAGNPGDNSLYLRLLRIGDVAHVSRVTCGYRIRTRHPDSWETQFRNVREYQALASRHLSHPPDGLAISRERLTRQLHAQLAVRGIALFKAAPGVHERESVRRWLRTQVWPGSVVGSVCRWLDELHCLAAAQWVVDTNATARAWLRPVVKRLRASIA